MSEPTRLFMCEKCGGSFDVENAEGYRDELVTLACELQLHPECMSEKKQKYTTNEFLLRESAIDPHLWEELCQRVRPHGGHFTLFKFTTNWRCALETPTAKDFYEYSWTLKALPEGRTANEAIAAAIDYYDSTTDKERAEKAKAMYHFDCR